MDSETSTRPGVDLLERMLIDETAEPTSVSLSLLESITNCFCDDQRIGSGGFAVVYKGIVGKGMIAVKKLTKYDLPEKKFLREVKCLMKAKHKNVVRFLGYCYEMKGEIADFKGETVISDIRNWLLCFEYVPNGSLDNYITDASCGLEWKKRYEIIKGICEGLLHLHDKRILHLDLKPGNILVDEHMVPKIADFGLSVCLREDQNWASTLNLYGSLGYLPPEFFRGQPGFASDIYSLGVIIVEMVTGQKGYPEDENVVENWRNRLEGSDQRDTQLEQVIVCTKIGMECMDSDPKKRPAASHIVDTLDKTSRTVETGISNSSFEQQVSFQNDQHCQGESAKLSPEYLGKDIKESAETEELGEYVGTLREDHWQQGKEDALGDQWSLWKAQYAQNGIPQGANISSSNSGLLYKLNNLGIFNTKAHKNYIKNGGPMLENVSHLKLFKKGELKPILKYSNLIGKGDFGEVYKGLVYNVPIVVRKPYSRGVLAIHIFTNEVIIQSQAHHKNIVRLIGCCLEVDDPILVYEFYSKDSLHDILHGNSTVPLNLSTRLSIAAVSAAGLAYMHTEGHTIMLHGDLKPEYILLDDKFEAKITNFGISRMFLKEELTGTRSISAAFNVSGCMDPIYLETRLPTKQSDVYSFGVVILELLTRKESKAFSIHSITRKFLENHKQGRKATELFDKEIAVTRDLELLDDLAKIVMECMNPDVEQRPTMVDVAKRLSILSKSRELALLQAS